jgi:S-adenosylmethionine synthetase
VKTAEFVTPKHPDKICDKISDTILNECLKQDKNSRVAIETMGGHKEIYITGELTSNAKINVKEIAKNIVGKNYKIKTNIVKQSNFIKHGVDSGGAGDQGIMIGYACNDNKQYLPHEYFLARDLAKFLYNEWPVDGKTQITVNKNNEIDNIVASFLGVKTSNLKDKIKKWKYYNGSKIYANPAGDWYNGGLDADAGLTGRKIIVDNYGPRIPVGGGAFSGKDPSKVDRSGAYIARHLAVELLKENNANEVIVKLAYAIGVEQPVMSVANIDGKEIELKKDLSYKVIAEKLNLYKIDYSKICEWGHYANEYIE